MVVNFSKYWTNTHERIIEANDVTFIAMAIRLDTKIELISQMIHFFLTKITVGGVTTINYFIYDLKDESYVLLCPAMYVR